MADAQTRPGARSEVPDAGGIEVDREGFEPRRRTFDVELATHRPLGQIRAFWGLRNKSENSMHRLRGFVYEMKGTRASSDEWCMPFQLSLKDAALHWHRQLPKKTKRTWSLLSSSFIRTYTSDEDDRHDVYDDYNDYDNHDGWNADESRYTDEEREEYEDSADEDDFVAAANEVERRNEADGTYARSDARVPKTEQSRGFNRDNRFQRQTNTDRFPRRQYGPCGACGDMSHSTHFCRRRCKFCKQVHEPVGVKSSKN
ncbi:Eukaryotic/viral aspartic protease [Phytophthora megakarya]|uniref:Eukaryotic/viral aspartic protease n=1 Tax=Phytophthora megakarya TaxID=4795 RepID=A0A225UJN9_9STRA|nr:Eukaryotic/viral aspartic protease [Phytophthora megakarya]